MGDEQLQNLEINKQCKQDNDDNDDVEMKNNENTDNDKKKKAKTSKKKTSKKKKVKKDKKTKKKTKKKKKSKNKNEETQNDDDTKKQGDIQKNDDQKVDLSEISKGKFIVAKLTDVMDKRYIIRRQKYTKATYQRMIAKKNRYRQWMMKEMKNETPIGMDIKRQCVFSEDKQLLLPTYHLRAVKQDWDCDLPRIRDIIQNFLKRDWKQWNDDDISCPKAAIAEIIDPENPAKNMEAIRVYTKRKRMDCLQLSIYQKTSCCLSMLVVSNQSVKQAKNWIIWNRSWIKQRSLICMVIWILIDVKIFGARRQMISW